MTGVQVAFPSGGNADNDGDGNLKANLPRDESKAGFAAASAEVDSGLKKPRLMRSGEVTDDYRARMARETPLIDMSFEGTVLRTNMYTQQTSGMTISQAVTGRLTLNAAGATAATNRAQIQTKRSIELFCSNMTYIEMVLEESGEGALQVISEIGAGYPGGGVAAPTDGVFLRRNAAGVLQLIVNYGGAETFENVDLTLVPDRQDVGVVNVTQRNHVLIAIGIDRVDCWYNNTRVASVAVPTNAGTPTLSVCVPLFARVYVPTGSTATAGRTLSLTYLAASTDAELRLSETTLSLMLGRGGYQTPDGVAVAQTANSVNSAAPATATLSNTAAGYTTLGGQWRAAAAVGAETDYALFAFQVPQGTKDLPGRALRLSHIRFGETVVEGAAVATAPTVLQWGVAVGSSAVSLATADGSATSSPKRDIIGSQSFLIAAAIGALAPGFDTDLELVAFPGEFVHVILKMPSGAATASQTLRGCVSIESHYI